jgi:transposase
MSPSPRGKPRILEPDHQQISIRFDDPDRTLAEDHLARVLFLILGRLDLSGFVRQAKSVEGHAGRPLLSVQMKLALWLYGISRGIGSAREIERLTRSDDAFAWLTRGLSVSHDTLSEFRIGHGPALRQLMVDVLASLQRMGLLDLSMVGQDGTRVRASASAPSFRRQASLQECRAQAELHLKAVLASADEADSIGHQALREAKARETLARVDAAIATVQELQQQRGYEKKEARASTTDADARVMKMPDGGFRPGYNFQFATAGSEFGGPRTIVGVNVTNVGSDMGSVAPMIRQVAQNTGRFPMVWLADANHARHACLAYAHRVGIAVLMAIPKREQAAPPPASPAVRAWRERMQEPEAKRLYKARAGLAELANAHGKDRFGLDQVLVRGLEKVGCVGVLMALAFNLTQHAAHLLG